MKGISHSNQSTCVIGWSRGFREGSLLDYRKRRVCYGLGRMRRNGDGEMRLAKCCGVPDICKCCVSLYSICRSQVSGLQYLQCENQLSFTLWNNLDYYVSLLQISREKGTRLAITNRIDDDECWSETLNFPTSEFAEVYFSSAYVLRAGPQVEARSPDFPGSLPTKNQYFLFMGVSSMV